MSTSTLHRATPLQTTGTTGMFRSLAPWLSRMVMLPPGLVFTLISIRFLTNPGHALAGVTLHTPEAFTDTRAMCAGLLTLLTMLIIFLVSRERLWLGHLQVATFMGVTLGIRIFGFIHDGTTLAMGNQRVITIAETVFLTLNTIGFVVQTRLFKHSGGTR
jgi:hypothetical protein